jgi:hypothetical protein
MGHGFNRFLGAVSGVGPRLASMEESLYRQGKMRGELYQDPAGRTAMMTDPWYRNLPGFDMTQVPRGAATLGAYPQLSPGDQPILPYITQIPRGLPPEVMTPERATMLHTQAATQQQALENEMYRKWTSGELQLPAGMQPMTMRAGPMTFGYPQIYQVPGDVGAEPFLGPGGGGGGGGGGLPRVTGGGGGATRATRNNNPGNIKASPFTQSLPGVTGIDPVPAADGGNFLIFDSPQSGFGGMKRLLKEGYGRLPTDRAMRRWSGGGYGAADLGLEPTRPIGAYSEQELDELSRRMAQREGFAPGPQRVQPAAAAPPRLLPGAQPPPGAPAAAAPAEAPPAEEAPASEEVLNAPWTTTPPAAAGAPPAPAPEEEGRVGYPSLAPAEEAGAPPVVAPPAPAPGAPPPAAVAPPPPPPAAPARPAPAAAAPPAPGAPVTPPGRVPVQKPSPISPKAIDDTRIAAANSPELAAYLAAHPELTANTRAVMTDPTVLQLRQKYWTDYQLTMDKAKATLSAEAKAALKALPEAAGDSVAGYLQSQRLLATLSANFTKEELEQFTGWFNNPAMRTKQAIATAGKFLGIDAGTVDKKFLAYKSLIGQIRSTMFAIGGKQLTNTEKPVIEEFIPTGKETGGADELVEKARQFDATARARVADLLATHNVGKPAVDRVLARQPPAASLFPGFEPTLGAGVGAPGATTTTTTLPPATRPPTTTTTPPPAAPPAGTPPAPPAGGAPAAPPSPGTTAGQGLPAGGTVSARQLVREGAPGPRGYTSSLLDRLGVPDLPPDEKLRLARAGATPEDVEMERARRAVTSPVTAGGVVRTLLGVLGAPGAVSGAATEAATGRPGLGTAVGLATDILAGGASGRAGARQLFSPAVPLRRLVALGEEAAPVAARTARRIGAGLPAGSTLAPGLAEARSALQAATRLTNPVAQGQQITRAATLLESAFGRAPEVRKLQRIGQDIATASSAVARRRLIQKAATITGGLGGGGALWEAGKRGVGRAWEWMQK